MINSGDRSSVDKSLLTCVLVSELRLIPEITLLKVVDQWKLGQQRQTIQDCLIEPGGLTVQQIAMLDSIADTQIQLCHGDCSRVLESITANQRISETLRRKIFGSGDQEHVNSSGGADDSSATLAKSSAEAVAESGRESGLRYVSTELHAEGGLGAVFRAKDTELNREVALKEIRPEFADDAASRTRFVLEAEITGGLEHPGIVPVYGFGYYDDGRPFYAMRLIQGVSLKEAVNRFHDGSSGRKEGLAAERSQVASSRYARLEFRQLLGRFVDVCQAVSYAHARGVLHRDLKPANIMLGDYGETLVVDWGLARVQGAESNSEQEPVLARRSLPETLLHQTLEGDAIGTPAYMSPEQAVGSLDQIGPASDVYSLGATLYHLLTGSAPIQATSRQEALKAVQAGSFRRPRQVESTIPGSLEAVCLKAMSLHPSDRYSSPLQLAEEIDRYLADEPVIAFTEPTAVRVRRWVRRHQTLAATTAAVIFVAAIGLGVFSAILGGVNRNLTEARSVAEQNEQTAREQSQVALSTLTFVIADTQEALRNLPGGGPVRRKLLTASLQKLESVSTKFLEQSSVDQTTARALTEMGDIVLTFGTEVPESGSASRDEDQSAVLLAESYYRRALEIAVELAKADPKDLQNQRALSLSHASLGKVLMILGKTDDGLQHLETELSIDRAILRDHPDDSQCLRDLAVSLVNVGDVYLRVGRTSDAENLFEESMSLRERLAALRPDDLDAQRDLDVCMERLGSVALKQGKHDEAKVHFEKLLSHTTELSKAHPDDSVLDRDLAICYRRLGSFLLENGQTLEAQGYFEKGLEIAERLSGGDPEDLSKRRDVAVACNKLGDVLSNRGLIDEAASRFRRSLEIGRELAEIDRNDMDRRRDVAIALGKLGDAAQQLRNLSEAEACYAEALQITESLASLEDNDVRGQRDLSVSWNDLGDLQLERENAEAAMVSFKKAMTIRRRLANADSKDAGLQRDLSVSCDRVGLALLALDRNEEALSQFEEGLTIRKALSNLSTRGAERQRDLSVSFDNIGDTLVKLNRLEEALRNYEESLKLRTVLAGQDEADSRKQRDVMVSHSNIGRVWMNLQEYQKAAESYEAGARVMQKLVDNGIKNESVHQELRRVERRAAAAREAIIAMGDWQELNSQPLEKLPKLMETRGLLCCRSSRFSDASQAAFRLRELSNADKGNLYNAACVFSLCAGALDFPGSGELTEESRAQKQVLINEAINTLRMAIDKGWDDFDQLRTDSDLAPLREFEGFQKLLQ
ncbi:MAG: serine/threonine protein kinase [Planctomyces sp.]|nr:serine/threonine protein kinase [Planctomyces sp.]